MKYVFIFVMITLIFLFPGCNPTQEKFSTPDTPTISPDHLLSDGELVTPEDPNAVWTNEAWSGWIRENYTPVRSLTASAYSDLQFLKPLLEGRRIVQLGESGHGVKEFNQARCKYLFVDMLFREESEGNSWMFTTIEAKSWGIYRHFMVLRDQYDGILFIHTVNPPDYL